MQKTGVNDIIINEPQQRKYFFGGDRTLKEKIKTFCIATVVIVLLLAACCATEKKKDIYLVLVNKENKLPDDWESKITLVTATNSLGEEFQVESEAYESFEALRGALLKTEGIQIELDSTYRSVQEQIDMIAWMDEEYGPGYADQYAAKPGYSEHHTGLAIDIFIIKDGEEIRDNDAMIADVEDFKKIHALMPRYGFILRYGEGQEEITGYAYEPWHLRYIGSVDKACKIASKGITLEEYLVAN